MAEIIQFITNNDKNAYQSLYQTEKEKVRSQHGERKISDGDGNPSIVIRQSTNRPNELEVVKTYELTNDEFVQRACGELNIMRRINEQGADICAAKLYEWQLIFADGRVLTSTRDSLNDEVENMLNAVDPLKAVEKEKRNPFDRAQTSIKEGYKRLMDEVSKIEIVMEYGVPLNDFLNGQESIEAPHQKIQMLFQALSDLHNTEVGVVHEDLKPSNVILVKKAGKVVPVFIDFDVSALHNVYHIPFAPYVGSTEYYESPEQAGEVECDPDTMDANGKLQLTPKTDVYSMGVIAFELLGTPLPENRTQREQFVSDHKTDSKVHEVLANALVKSPGTRSDAGGILKGLLEICEDMPVHDRFQEAEGTPSQFNGDDEGRNKIIAVAIVAIVAIMALVIIAIVVGVKEDYPNPSPVPDNTYETTLTFTNSSSYELPTTTTIYLATTTTCHTFSDTTQTLALPAVTDNVTEATVTSADATDININVTDNEGLIVGVVEGDINIGGESHQPESNSFSENTPYADDSPTVNFAETTVAPTTTTTTTTVKATTLATTTTPAIITGVDENGLAYEIVDGRAVITGYYGTATEVVIPEYVAGVPVYAIGENAFKYETDIEKVVIKGYKYYDAITGAPEKVGGVQKIEVEAFYGCTALKEVWLPASICYIGPGAFIRNNDADIITIYYEHSPERWNNETEVVKIQAGFEESYIETLAVY